MAPDLHEHRGEPARRGAHPGASGALLADPLPEALDVAARAWLEHEGGSGNHARTASSEPVDPSGALDHSGWRLDLPDSLGRMEGAEIAQIAPGGHAALLLQGLDPRTADDVALVEAVALTQRLTSWLHRHAATLAAELSHRDSMNPVWSAAAGGPPAVSDVAGDELAMRLACSRRAGRTLVREGRAYCGPLVATGDALARGELTPGQARHLVDRLEQVALPVAIEVEDRVLPGAERRTPSQWRADVERALLTVDPADAAARCTRARRGRHVDHPRPLPDGMAGMWAVLPATDALRIDGVLDSAARSARSAGDPRTLDQLRADGLTDLVVRDILLPGPAAESTTTADPLTAGSTADLLTAGATVSATNADLLTAGLLTAGPTTADLAVASPTAAGPTTSSPTAASPTTSSSRETGCAEAAGQQTSRRRTRPTFRVNVTVGLSTLLGQDDLPAEVAGFGPVDAVTARALAEDAVWRRLVTDPLSGAVLDVGRTSYRPPAALAEHVRARDGICARPGCSTPAHACDLGHTVEFNGPDQGTTSAGNLGPLCRRDHRLKTEGGHRLAQISPGEYVWISAAGLRYRVLPGDNGRSELIGSGRHRGLAPPGGSQDRDRPPAPPF